MIDAGNAKTIVARGYDAIAGRYAEWAGGIVDVTRERVTPLLRARFPAGSALLDLGCGGGGPTTREWADHFALLGVDSSRSQVALARACVPNGTFMVADMAEFAFPPASFDVVTALYSLIHVPRVEHEALLGRIAGWLRPGGLFVATMGAADNPGAVEPDWLGAPMFFNHFDAATNRRLVMETGLAVEFAEEVTIWEYGQPARFLWIVARA